MISPLLFLNNGTNFHSDIELVYLENREEIPEVDGTTYLARVNKSFRSNGKYFHEIILLTDSNGNNIISNNFIIVNDDKIVSNRTYHTINPRKIYHFSNIITAKNFVTKSDINNRLESSSRTALGSGIYGYYVSDKSKIDVLMTDKTQTVYEIDMKDAYNVQDKEHGESITIASLVTNRYIDKIISLVFNRDDNDYINMLNYIKNDNIENLVTLWNIVFYRTNNNISYELLQSILAGYLAKYFTISTIIDTHTKQELIELPINYIMSSLGYIGLITTENMWDRSSVSYQYEPDDVLVGSKALW